MKRLLTAIFAASLCLSAGAAAQNTNTSTAAANANAARQSRKWPATCFN